MISVTLHEVQTTHAPPDLYAGGIVTPLPFVQPPPPPPPPPPLSIPRRGAGGGDRRLVPKENAPVSYCGGGGGESDRGPPFNVGDLLNP